MFFLLKLAISLAIAFALALFGFIASRRFVENRLRYVDSCWAVQNREQQYSAACLEMQLLA